VWGRRQLLNLEAVKIGNRCAAGHVQQLADTTLAAGLR